ncbi:MAG: DUF4124 domain-containing protein [Thermodesulfobacteriota bacterium]|nr:DUF4124 domain-containing protein [Thermodesulfobacteriota bacterium]
MKISFWFKLVIATVCVISASISFAQGTIYKWTDEKGVVHYTDNPENVPSKFKGCAEQKTIDRRLSPPPAPEKSAAPPVSPVLPQVSSEEKPDTRTDVRGRNKEWWLGQKKKWQDEVKRLTEQVKKNNEDIVTLRRGRVRQGTRTEEGIILNQGPLIDDYRELKRLQEITPELEEKLQKAKYMLEEDLIRDAYRASVPPEWIEELKSK